MSFSRPLIGLLPDYKEGGATQYSSRPHYFLGCSYARNINEAGGLVVILPYDYLLIDSYLERLSGITLVGGAFDIHPSKYGESSVHPKTTLNQARGDFEYAFLSKALAVAQMPILGICNGMQLINVLQGGNLMQHIPDFKELMDHEQKNSQDFKDYAKPYHQVNISQGSKLFDIVGEKIIYTNSSHHQAVKKLGKEIKAVAKTEDGVIEAIEHSAHPFCLGVQWHAELNSSPADKKIFTAFVAASKKYAKSKNSK